MDVTSSSAYNAQAVVSSIFAQAESIASAVGGPASAAATSIAIALSSLSAPLAASSSSAPPRLSSSSYVGVSGSSSSSGRTGLSDAGQKVSSGTIAGAVVGGIAGLAIILSIGIWLYWRSKRRKQKEKITSEFAVDDEPRVVPFQDPYGQLASSRGGDPSNSIPPPLRDVGNEPPGVSWRGQQSLPSRFATNRLSNEKEEPSDLVGLHSLTSRDSTAKYGEGSGVPLLSANQGYHSSAANDTTEDRAVDAGPLRSQGQLPPAYNPEWEAGPHRREG